MQKGGKNYCLATSSCLLGTTRLLTMANSSLAPVVLRRGAISTLLNNILLLNIHAYRQTRDKLQKTFLACENISAPLSPLRSGKIYRSLSSVGRGRRREKRISQAWASDAW
jgi:hypothetical protein